MAHIHTCSDCDADFSCDALEIESEHREGCSVEPALCPSCADSANEAAHEASLSSYYGGASECTDRERMASADRLNREGRR